MKFDGVTYDPVYDKDRLTRQNEIIRNLMQDHEWRTLREINKETGFPEASISAQLRDFRKKRWGFQVVERRPRGHRKLGLYEYRLMPKGYKSEYEMVERKNRYKECLEVVWKKHPECRNTIREFFDNK